MNDYITKHFRLSEAVCNDGLESMETSPEFFRFTNMAELFRLWYSRVMDPESWYRTPEYNKKIGGASSSQHLLAVAMDIHFPEEELPMTRERMDQFLLNCKTYWFLVCDMINENPVYKAMGLEPVQGGFFYYDWGFHFDARTTERRHRDYRTEKSQNGVDA